MDSLAREFSPKHDPLCAAVGGYGYCDCGRDTYAENASAAAAPSAKESGLHKEPIFDEIMDTLLTIIIHDNRSFKGTPPCMSKRRAHIRKAMKLYDKLMQARNGKE